MKNFLSSLVALLRRLLPSKSFLPNLKRRLADPEDNLILGILTVIPMILLVAGVIFLKKTPPVSKIVKPGTTTVEMKKIEEELEPPNPEEGLHVIAYTPAGEVSTEVEGIKILFDHSMIPMTDVDPDKHPTIPLTITPPIPGEFVWYGTKGFVYRFSKPLPLATTFKASLPGSLSALDKKTLEKDFRWEFYTPPPRVSGISPQNRQNYIPPKTAVKLSFSQPMKREAVEKAFECQTWKDPPKGLQPEKEKCPTSFHFTWESTPKGEEILTATPDQPYAFDRNFEIHLPKGLLPHDGDQGVLSDFSLNFSTSGPMALDRIEITHPYPAIDNSADLILYQPPLPSETPPETQPKAPVKAEAKTKSKKGKTEEEEEAEEKVKVPTGDLCFSFSNPVSRASFESAVQVVPLTQTKPDPNFRVSYYYEDEVSATDEEKEAAQSPADLPHRTACINTDLKFQTPYEIRIVKPITDRNGQPVPLQGIPLPLKFETMHASLEGTLDVTKNIFNAKKPPLVPFTSMNAERVDIRLIPCAISADTVQSGGGNCIEAYDTKRAGETGQEPEAPDAAAETPESTAAAESNPESQASTEAKDPLVRQVPIAAEYDAYHHGHIDLSILYPNLKPGLYEIEAKFQPLSEITLKKKFKKLGIEQEALVTVDPVTTHTRVQLTDTALALKTYENQIFIWAVDIATGEGKVGLPLQVWKDNTLIATGFTDGEGLFRFINNTIDFSYEKLTVVADDPKGFSYLSSDDSKGIEPDAFGVSYARPNLVKNYFAFLHTDRPLYRPSQTVHFSGFLRGLREGVYRLPNDLSTVEVSLTDPSGTTIYQKELPLSPTGVFGDEWTLGDDSIPRGRYHVTAKVPTLSWKGESETQTFDKIFYVASYKKPDFKISLETDRKDFLSGEPIHLTARGSYFFGAPLSHAKVDWSIRQEGFRFSPEKYRDFLFVDEEAIQKVLKRSQEGKEISYEEGEAYEGDGKEVSAGVYSTDSESRLEDPKLKPDAATGPARTGIRALIIPGQQAGLGKDGLFALETTPNLSAEPTSQIYTLTITAKEMGQEVSNVTDLRIHQSSVYVGLKPERRVYAKGQPMQIELVTLDPDAKVVANQPIALKLFKRDYMTVKKRTKDGKWVFESQPKDTLVAENTVTTNGEGKVSFSRTAEEGGTYRLVATSQDKQGRSTTAAVHIGVGGDPDAAWKMSAEDRITLVPDKTVYKAGETAQLLIPFPTGGMHGLLTVEKGGILEHKILKFDGAQNTVSVALKESHIPNIYVSLLLFRPQGAQPAFMKMGLAELKVDPEKKHLTTTIKPEKDHYAPKEKVKLTIRTVDDQGRGVPADLILSVADESVLRLIDYQSPDLLKRFYFNRKLGVLTALNMIHYKSGDAPGLDIEKKKRAKFLDTAFFTSKLRTNANGEIETEFTLPDNITTWVAEAFAISDETQVGSTFASFRSALPVFLRPSLPRFLAVEDDAQPVLFVENTSQEPYEGSVGIKVTGDASLSTPAEQPVHVDAGGRTPISFGLKGMKKGETRLTLTARDSQKAPMDLLELPLPIYDRSVPILYTAGGATREKAVEQLQIPGGTRKDRGDLRVTVGTSPMKVLQEAVGYLLEYPYGCAEQRTSALIGLWQLLSVSNTLKALGTQELPVSLQKVYADRYRTADKPVGAAEIKKSLEQGLSSLYDFQQGDGGFGFWKEDRVSDVFLSADMARAFRLFAAAGIAVDAEVQKRLNQYLTDTLIRQKPLPRPPPGKPDLRRYEADSRAALTWGLGKDDAKTAEGALKSLLEMQDVLGPRGLASLILALKTIDETAYAGDIKDLVKRLRKQVQTAKGPQGEIAYWDDPSHVWDAVTTTAVALQALLSHQADDELAEPGARYLISKAKLGNFGHTQATRESLSALWQYSTAPHKDKGNVPVTLSVASANKTEDLPAYSLSHWLEEIFPLDKLPADTLFGIQIAKPEKAPGALYYQATLTSYFPMDLVPRKEDGLIISREFYAIDDLKEEHPLKSFKRGESYKASLTVMVPKTLSQLTVEHLLPAGFEPVDFELSTSNQELKESLNQSENSPVALPSAFTHEEIHDDRVMWYGARVPAGIYNIRHVVRASTVGQFQAPGATAFPFYDTGYFGRSRSMVVKVEGENP
ncbi:MAG: MG2 domain-containing protein [bacterium]